MGGRGSGRYRRGSRKPGTAIREYSLVLDAKELVASGVIRGDKRHGGRIESILSGGPTSSAAGRYLCDCRDTLPLWSQTAERRRLQLGTLSLEFERNGDSATQVVAILAGLTRLDFVYWGFACPRCLRYARKLYLPHGRLNLACRRCHRLRYISQQKLDAWARRWADEWDAVAIQKGFLSERMLRKIQVAGLASIGFRPIG